MKLESALTRNEKLAVTGVALATLLTYASTFTFGWVYDDPPQIPQNSNLEWSRVGFLFTHHLWAGTVGGSEGRFYRPLLSLWFLLNKTLFGLHPQWFHVTTVLAHVAATILAFFVARSILKNSGAALVASAFFGLHPLQTETASWISSVNDSLAAVLCFSTFLAYREARSKKLHTASWWAASGAAFVLALLTKEISIVLPALILVDLWASEKDEPVAADRGSFRVVFVLYGSLGVTWLAFRTWVVGAAATETSPIAWSAVVLSAPKIILFDFYRVIVPVGLSPQYDLRLVKSASAEFFLTLFVLIVVAWVSLAAAKRLRILVIAFAWFLLPLLPTLNVRWMNEDDFIHDRYTYMSVFGVALIVAAIYAWIRRRWPEAQLARSLAAALLLILALASATQSQYWANDVILFSRAVNRAPENEWAQLNYGAALSGRGKFAEAAPHFVKSYKLKPGWRAADFAGFSYQQSGDLPKAEHWFQMALQQDPSQATAWFGLAQIALAQHQPDQAISSLEKALAFQPEADGYHYELGKAFEQASRPGDALAAYKKELELHPSQTAARSAVERLETPKVQSVR